MDSWVLLEILIIVAGVAFLIYKDKNKVIKEKNKLEGRVLYLTARERILVKNINDMKRLYKTLQESQATSGWRTVFGIEKTRNPTISEIEEIWRVKAKYAHSDKGGNDERMKILNVARDNARKELGN